MKPKKDPVIFEKLGHRAIFRQSGLRQINLLFIKKIPMIIHQFFENLHTAPLVLRGTVLMQLLYFTDESIIWIPHFLSYIFTIS